MKALKGMALAGVGALAIVAATEIWLSQDWTWCPNCAYVGPTERMNESIALGNALKLPQGFVQQSGGGKKSDPPIQSETLRDGGLILIREGQREVAPTNNAESSVSEITQLTRRVFQVADWKPNQAAFRASTVIWPVPVEGNLTKSINPVTGAVVIVAANCDILVAQQQRDTGYGNGLVWLPKQSNTKCSGISFDPMRPDVTYVQASLTENEQRYIVIKGGQTRLSPNLVASAQNQLAGTNAAKNKPEFQFILAGDGAVNVTVGWSEDLTRPNLPDISIKELHSAVLTCTIEIGKCRLPSQSPKIKVQTTKSAPNRAEITLADGAIVPFSTSVKVPFITSETDILEFAISHLQKPREFMVLAELSEMPANVRINSDPFYPKWMPIWLYSRLQPRQTFDFSYLANTAEALKKLTKIMTVYDNKGNEPVSSSASREDATGKKLVSWDVIGSMFGREPKNSSGQHPVLEKSEVFGKISSNIPIGNLACLDDRAETLRKVEFDELDGNGEPIKSTKYVIDPQAVRSLSAGVSVVETVSGTALNNAPSRWLLFQVSSDLPADPLEAIDKVFAQQSVELVQAPTADKLCD